MLPLLKAGFDRVCSFRHHVYKKRKHSKQKNTFLKVFITRQEETCIISELQIAGGHQAKSK